MFGHVMILTSSMQCVEGYMVTLKYFDINICLDKRISDILSWDRTSYLTNVILSRLSLESCTFVVLELKHMVVK